MKIIKKNKKHNFKKNVMEGYFVVTLTRHHTPAVIKDEYIKWWVHANRFGNTIIVKR